MVQINNPFNPFKGTNQNKYCQLCPEASSTNSVDPDQTAPTEAG